ncbi:unnamed protein product [Danaus chrysippus]|uniref:(African queen) hypothetical protein n=1 Tax=Danaus chrysippus TaxID=151541 RepID=A0A8J2QU83_9NEOP|nr:unnamed protein product [Danaus chrysippus]
MGYNFGEIIKNWLACPMGISGALPKAAMLMLPAKIDDRVTAATLALRETLIGEINNQTMVRYESPEPQDGEESKKL